MAREKKRKEKVLTKKGLVKDLCLSVFTGVLIFVALSFLLNPEISEIKATWATFYGDF